MNHFFHELNNHARKEFKFQQRKSLDFIPASDGVCLALVLMWIKEKLTSTNASFLGMRFGGSQVFLPGSGDGANVHDRNAHTMVRADVFQGRLERGDDISPVERAVGLSRIAYPISTRRTRRDNVPVADLARTLADAAINLQAGHAACFEISVWVSDKSAGHAVGLYKSRGNSIHFFDPNAGVYKVRDAASFMQAWIEGCGRRGWTVGQMIRYNDEDSWYHVYSR